MITIAVSGGFDPVHIGHLRMFKDASKLGDRLIIILNNDYWLRAKKGYVFMKQEDRKEILESFACVDEVILTYHEAYPKDMSICSELSVVRPTVFVNGGDRYADNIPEYQLCNDLGIEMVFNVGFGGKIRSSSYMVGKHKEEIIK